MVKLELQQFKTLMDRLTEAFEEENRGKLTLHSMKWFGINGETDGYNICKSIIARTNPQGIYSPKYLYNRRNELKKIERQGGGCVSINDFYLDCWLKYIGEESVQAMMNKQPSLQREYKGYYYDPTKHEVCTFELFFKDLKNDWRELEATVAFNGKSFVGKGGLNPPFVEFLLDCQRKDEKERMRIDVTPQDTLLDNNVPLDGVMTTYYSYRSRIVTSEVRLLPKALVKDQELNAIRYITLNHQAFSVLPKETQRHDYSFIGVYLVWRFDRSGNIVQTKLVIREDLSATLYLDLHTEDKDNEQVCRLFVLNPSNGGRLHIETYRDGKAANPALLINSAIVNFGYKLTNGHFSSVGIGEEEPYGMDLVFFKVSEKPADEQDKEEWAPKIIRKENIEQYIEGDAERLAMFRKLRHKQEQQNLLENFTH